MEQLVLGQCGGVEVVGVVGLSWMERDIGNVEGGNDIVPVHQAILCDFLYPDDVGAQIDPVAAVRRDVGHPVDRLIRVQDRVGEVVQDELAFRRAAL